MSILTPTQLSFFKSQCQHKKVNKNGMRWNNDVKQLALSIYFKSPSLYSHLSKVFSLPSKRLLQRDLAKVKFEPGILYNIIDYMKIKLEDVKPQEKFVTLAFDAISLMPHLQQVGSDIAGYECLGNNKHTCLIASHALVFSIRCITTKWKQPVA